MQLSGILCHWYAHLGKYTNSIPIATSESHNCSTCLSKNNSKVRKSWPSLRFVKDVVKGASDPTYCRCLEWKSGAGNRKRLNLRTFQLFYWIEEKNHTHNGGGLLNSCSEKSIAASSPSVAKQRLFVRVVASLFLLCSYECRIVLYSVPFHFFIPQRLRQAISRQFFVNMNSFTW